MTWLKPLLWHDSERLGLSERTRKKRSIQSVPPINLIEMGVERLFFPTCHRQSCWKKKWIKVWWSCRLHPLHFLPGWPWFLMWLRCRSGTIPSIILTSCFCAWRPSFPFQLSRAAYENRHLLDSWMRLCLKDCLSSVCCRVASVKGNYNFHFKVPWESGAALLSLLQQWCFFFPFYSFFNEHWMTIAVRSR